MLTTLASMFTSVHHVLLLLFCRCASPSLNLTKARFIEKQKRKVNALRKRRTAFNIFCCRLVCWPQQYLPMNTTEDEDTTAALHCRTNVARLRRETFQNNRFHWWNKPDEPLLMMLRFQALISPTAGVDGDATETRGDCMCAHFQHRAWMVQQTCRQYTCILKKKRKRRLQLCSPVNGTATLRSCIGGRTPRQCARSLADSGEHTSLNEQTAFLYNHHQWNEKWLEVSCFTPTTTAVFIFIRSTLLLLSNSKKGLEAAGSSGLDFSAIMWS